MHKSFRWKTYRKRPFGRPRQRQEDNITIDLKETECESIE
jgi:hypothetical protein